jgi:hypothetical protein
LLLQVVVREESKHWYKFLTTLCAGELRRQRLQLCAAQTACF